MLLEYRGPKPLPYKLNTPIPFVSRSDREGVLEFTPQCEVENPDWAAFLLQECGEYFFEADKPINKFAPISEEERAKRHAERVAATIGKKFRGKPGKWQAQAFLKRHHLTDDLGLKKLQIGDKVMHWECVPIALADVRVGHTAEEPPIPADAEGLEEGDHEREDRTI